MISRTNINANETPVSRNPKTIKDEALNDIEISKSDKKTELRMKLWNAFKCLGIKRHSKISF